VVPIGNDQWELVAELHNICYARCTRTVDSIKRKLCSLADRVPKTGNPSLPPHVALAKESHEAINIKADVTNADVSDFLMREMI
jgi:hypothetical protein